MHMYIYICIHTTLLISSWMVQNTVACSRIFVTASPVRRRCRAACGAEREESGGWVKWIKDGGFHRWGYPNSWMVSKGKSHLEMEDYPKMVGLLYGKTNLNGWFSWEEPQVSSIYRWDYPLQAIYENGYPHLWKPPHGAWKHQQSGKYVNNNIYILLGILGTIDQE